VTVGVTLPNDDEEGEEDDEEGESEEAEEANRDFRSLQAERDDSNRDQLQTLENQVERLGIGDEIWAELMQDAYYRQSLFDSHCVLNDLRGVASLLETYKDDPFVSWRTRTVSTVSP
jgi:hypothetical protein